VLFGQGTGGYVSLNTALLDDYNKIPTGNERQIRLEPKDGHRQPLRAGCDYSDGHSASER
jgi:hypothetical protein